ncbi:MAG: LysR substrate-binding domain-containing protein [Gammaproteobacteria bacterium]|jgi:LysR family hydrogen peroxide-inducible transcriptional activator|nr:LysR substrate-binding domain-containing protein [Gammaproteobacteria bacterium]
MNLRDLQYLVALAETGHFGEAAERCHVSQPTLSAQIKKLEDYLGVQLFERQPKKVSLTEVGRLIVERARHVTQEAEDIRELARASRDPLTGKLRVGLIPTIAPYLLPRVAVKLRRQLPDLLLMLYEYQTGPLLQKLRDGELDLAILALPADTSGLETRSLFAESFVVAMPRNHALAARKRLKPADLAGEKILLLEEGHCLRDQALEVCGTVALSEEQDFRATSLETLRQMVAGGHGVTLLPRLAAEGPIASARGLEYRPFSPPSPSRMVGAAWRRSSTRETAITAVCDVIASAGR